MDEDVLRPLEADVIDGVRPPRETPEALGHAAARAAFVSSWESGRVAHAWMLCGPRGVGKATLAYELARRVLAADGTAGLGGGQAAAGGGDAPQSAERRVGQVAQPVAQQVAQQVARQVASGAHPRLVELKRGVNEKTKRAKAGVSVEDARRLGRFFALSAADGGWRAAIIDSVDELTREAANALLKNVEEPPNRVVFFLIHHGERPAPPTLLSRCRRLSLTGLDAATALSALAAAHGGLEEAEEEAAKGLLRLTAGPGGASPGAAARLMAVDGDAIYGDVLALLARLPRRDAAAIERLSGARGRGGAERFAAVALLLPLALERLARAGALGPDRVDLSPTEARLVSRLAPDLAMARVWARAAARTRAILAEQAELNLDPGRVLLDIVSRLEEEAGRSPPPPVAALAGF